MGAAGSLNYLAAELAASQARGNPDYLVGNEVSLADVVWWARINDPPYLALLHAGPPCGWPQVLFWYIRMTQVAGCSHAHSIWYTAGYNAAALAAAVPPNLQQQDWSF